MTIIIDKDNPAEDTYFVICTKERRYQISIMTLLFGDYSCERIPLTEYQHLIIVHPFDEHQNERIQWRILEQRYTWCKFLWFKRKPVSWYRVEYKDDHGECSLGGTRTRPTTEQAYHQLYDQLL